MGLIAAKTLLRRINDASRGRYPKEIVVEPSLVVRGSTTQVFAKRAETQSLAT